MVRPRTSERRRRQQESGKEKMVLKTLFFLSSGCWYDMLIQTDSVHNNWRSAAAARQLYSMTTRSGFFLHCFLFVHAWIMIRAHCSESTLGAEVVRWGIDRAEVYYWMMMVDDNKANSPAVQQTSWCWLTGCWGWQTVRKSIDGVGTCQMDSWHFANIKDDDDDDDDYIATTCVMMGPYSPEHSSISRSVFVYVKEDETTTTTTMQQQQQHKIFHYENKPLLILLLRCLSSQISFAAWMLDSFVFQPSFVSTSSALDSIQYSIIFNLIFKKNDFL